MRRLFSIILGITLLSGAGVSGGDVRARLTLTTGRVLSGALTARLPDAVHFKRSVDGTTVSAPDTHIKQIYYSPEGYDPKKMKTLFEEGKYNELVELYETQLVPMLPYAALPSNLDGEYLRWMIAAYWSGNPARVPELANLVAADDPLQSRYYRGLAQLDGGTLQTLETILNQSDVDTIYPPSSPARLYLEARRLQLQNHPLLAIRTAARLIAKHGSNMDWMPPAELLCAELYFELEMPESAQAVLADIKEFYSNPDIQRKAAALAAQNNGEKR